MEKKFLISLTIIFGMVLAGCQNYFFEEIETEQFNNIDNLLVVNAIIEQKSGKLAVQLFETTAPGGNPFKALREGTVDIFRNNNFVRSEEVRENQSNESQDSYGVITYLHNLTSNDTIKLEVKHPKYEMTTAEIQMISPPQMLNHQRQYFAYHDDYFGDMDILNFDFIPNKNSYHTIMAFYKSAPYVFTSLYSKQYEGIGTYGYKGYKFSGTTFTFNQSLTHQNIIPFEFYCNFGDLSSLYEIKANDQIWYFVESYDFNISNYKYQISQQDSALRNPYLIPKEIIGNWSNSYGYFGAMRRDSLNY